MWTCPQCQEVLEDNFKECWNCGTSRSGVRDEEFAAESIPDGLATTSHRLPMDCLRCGRGLDQMGTRHFHEGVRWGFLGDLAELVVNREGFDVYACSNCGHVEFFMTGVGLGQDE